MIKFIFFILSFSILTPAWSAIMVAKHSGSGFSKVSAESIESTCGSNFAFRDQHKTDIPKYLEPELIKLSFKGVKLHSSIDSAKAAASKGGKCVWYTDAEKSTLGL